MTPPFPPQPGDVTPEWLTAVLRRSGAVGPHATVIGVTHDSLSEGVGMMGTVSRLHLDYENPADGPRSLILKSASEAPMSRQVAAKFRPYEREVNFYLGLGEALEPQVPHAYYAAYAPETIDYAILMEDFEGYCTGDQVVGADIDQARCAVEALARFHALYWNRTDDPALDWVPSTDSELVRESMIAGCIGGWDKMVDLFADLLPEQLKQAKSAYLSRLPAMYASMVEGHQTLAHTDYRADNLLFGAQPGHQPIVILDWSAVAKSKGVQDLAYFLTQNLSDHCRGNHEAELHALYYETLVKEGVDGYSFEEFDRDYEMGVLFNFVYAIVIASALDISNERATAFVGKLASRSAECIVERNLLETLLPTLPATGATA
jgi:aminoglycoside phosphotransferase (APT) family kinase protein